MENKVCIGQTVTHQSFGDAGLGMNAAASAITPAIAVFTKVRCAVALYLKREQFWYLYIPCGKLIPIVNSRSANLVSLSKKIKKKIVRKLIWQMASGCVDTGTSHSLFPGPL